jgi:uncharacterized membrane protein
MLFLIQLVATLSTGLFSGAALYINLVEHPARILCGTAIAVTEFGPSYKRAAVMQATLAVLGSFSGIIAWLLSSRITWLLGGLLLGAVIPFTFIIIFPVNRKLLDPSLDKNSVLASEFLSRWGKLHAVRSVLSLIAFMLYIVSLILAI